jgi:hypothetical protein
MCFVAELVAHADGDHVSTLQMGMQTLQTLQIKLSTNQITPEGTSLFPCPIFSLARHPEILIHYMGTTWRVGEQNERSPS